MWIVSKPFSLVGFLAGLAGILAVAAGSQLQFLFTAADQTPHALTVMELSDNGTAGNAHVELTGFKFGKPVIEKGPHDEWTAVWLPLDRVPETARPLRRPVYFHTTHLHDQTALNDFVKQKRLRLLVASSMPDSTLFSVKPSTALWLAEPSLDPTKTVFLTDRQIDVGGVPALAGDQLLNHSNLRLCYAGAGVAFLVALFGLYVGSVPVMPRAALPADKAAARQAMLSEPSVSVHNFLKSQFIARQAIPAAIGVTMLVAMSLGAAAFGLLEAAQSPLSLERLAIISACGVALVGLFTIAWRIASRVIVKYRGSVVEVVVCSHGMRWRIGRRWDSAMWSDVKSVSRGEAVVRRSQGDVNRAGECRVTLRDGRNLVFERGTMSDYSLLASEIQTTTSDVVLAQKQKDLATGEAKFGPVVVNKAGLLIDW